MRKILFYLIISIFINECITFAQAEPMKIGYCMDELYMERWQKDKEYLEKKIKELGGELLVEVANSDQDLQFEQAKNLIDKGIKLLILTPVDSKVGAKIVDLAHENNLIVLGYDRIVSNCKLDYYISFDNILVGKLMAEYAISKIPKGNYVIIGGPVRDGNAIAFYNGNRNYLKPYIDKGDITLIYDKHLSDWSHMESYNVVSDVLSEYHDIDVILASNDALASGAIMALEVFDKAGEVLVTGQDASLEACRNIMEGKQSMTVYKPIKLLAEKAAEIAIKLANNEKVEIDKTINNGMIEVPSILLTPISVTKENLESTVIKDKHIAAEDLK